MPAMTEVLFALLVDYGAVLIMAVTFASCVALPVPASLVMLVAGALAAAGDLGLSNLLVGAYVGAVLGDIAGYWMARGLEGALATRLSPGPRVRALMSEARRQLLARGGVAVFLTRWLLSPLGPYVNFAAGASRMPMRVFLPWDAAGELIWVTGYLGLGYTAASQLPQVIAMASNFAGLTMAVAVALVLMLWLQWKMRQLRAKRRAETDPAAP